MYVRDESWRVGKCVSFLEILRDSKTIKPAAMQDDGDPIGVQFSPEQFREPQIIANFTHCDKPARLIIRFSHCRCAIFGFTRSVDKSLIN